ncbi:MAG: DUF2065 domain-containing protein [Proteobacteria bacterium]|nr:DUF2065 domain-containing protein [Pseudomonadota bacterium]
MVDLITALGLAIAIEGIAYALFPDGMKKMMAQVITLPSTNIRAAGLAAAAGIFILWLVRG